ncbi:MAG: type IV secretion system DNA-binding domain-containing protein [bacterium]
MDYGLTNNSVATGSPSDFFITLILTLVSLGIIVALIYLFLLFLKKFVFSHKFFTAVYHKKIFRLSVPSMVLDKEDEHKDAKDLLAGIENLYANLGGLPHQHGFKYWLFGRYDAWSFEIIKDKEGLISFYVAIPVYLENYIKQQFLSLYPHCQIEEIEDYNIFQDRGFVVAGYLKLKKANMFPILTYKQMNMDPLTSVLTVLSKLPEGQTAAVQLVMRSADPAWRKSGVKVASEMQQGKKLNDALTSASSNSIVSAVGKPSDWFYTGTEKDRTEKPQYRLSPMEEQMVKGIEEKASKSGLDVNLRLVAFAPLENQAKEILRYLANSFAQYSSYEYANSFKAVIKGNGQKIIHDFIYRSFNEKTGSVLNTEEMTSLWHLPLPETQVPRIRWLMARRLPPPYNLPSEGIILGRSLYRGEETLVRIKSKDRQRHMYVIGMTGTGKTYLMSHMAIQDIINGHGVCIVDPHGSFVEDILPFIPKDRLDDVVIFDPSDADRPIGLNMLEAKTPYEMDMAAQEMITIFYKLLPDPAMAGPMFEHYMRNALLALMADQTNPGTLVELARIFTDEDFRKEKLSHVKDIMVKDFWEREYTASQKGSTASDMLSYVISKTGRFVENETMRNIIGQPKSGINFREIMDGQKILLMNLSKGKIGETNSNLLGLIAVSKLQMAALGRADMPEEQRKDFYLYIDEFQNFITDSISTILAEARKYRLNLIVGHQYIAQLTQNNDTRVRDAIFGNVGTVASYRIGVDDAETIAKQLGPKVSEYDLLNAEKFTPYVRLLIDNTASDAFNMQVYNFKDYFEGNQQIVAPLKELSRLKHGRDRKLVIREIVERSKIGQLGKV